MVSSARCGLKPCLSTWKSFGLGLPAPQGLPSTERGIYPDAVRVKKPYLLFTLNYFINSFHASIHASRLVAMSS